MPAISALYVYPLKSARGVSLDAMALDARGPVGDRRWMLVDDDDIFISLREIPKMALLQAAPTIDGLRLSAPGRPSLDVVQPRAGNGTRRFIAQVWEASCAVLAADPAASAWLSDFLDTRCRLVYQPDDSIRPLPRRNAGRIAEDRNIALTDGAALLLIGEASLADLNSRLESPIPMSRFRPNIVVSGTTPYEEDRWTGIESGGVSFEVARACPRCVATTVDQATGTKGVEPLRTLSTYRRGNDGVLFGQNVTHVEPGTIRIGEAIEVIDWRPARNG